MNKTASEAASFIKELAESVKGAKNEVLICVPYTNLETAVKLTEGTNIAVGAENMDYHDSGAYTGEVSADMLLDLGVKYVVIGHSERREYYNETDKTVNAKVLKAIEKGITPVLCCGESLEQREDNITFEWVRMQIKIALFKLYSFNLGIMTPIAFCYLYIIHIIKGYGDFIFRNCSCSHI